MSLIEKKMKSLVYTQVLLFIYVKLLWLHINALENDTDHFALLKFKEGITSDPYRILKSWNGSVPFCKWDGITCTRRSQRVTSLVLNDQSLSGYISPYIGNLTLLRFIDLQGNNLNGEIPQEVGRLFRLQRFLLYKNTIKGEIPVSIANCTQLRMLWLTYNNFTGRIPVELGSFPRIQVLALGTNNLEGEIPSSLGNISSLRVLSLPYNNLGGSIPEDLGRLRDLTYFFVAANTLSGVIPPSIFNISSLTFISVAKNQLHGNLPDNIGLYLPNLTDFLIGYNQFSGSIPSSIRNASRLERVDMIQNNLSGQIPTDLGKLQGLSWLNLGSNNLGTNSANDLVFFASLTNCSKLRAFSINSNRFGGTLPIFAANFSIQLNYFDIGNNRISGTIPAALDNLVNLIGLSMEGNLLTGSIPSSVGKFQNLQVLKLDRNSFSGSIPSSLSNLTRLTELHLFINKFDGSIPSSIGNCQMLNYIDLSQNNLHGEVPPQILLLSSLSKTLNLSNNLLTGKLPPEVGKLVNLNALNISHNNLSGHIPSAIGDCKNLEYLYLQQNSFEGTIPSSLASLRGLRSLDLSRNNLSGQIPKDLQDISFLQYLNLSFNDLDGEVPAEGVFRNARAVSLLGNNKLCGGDPEHNLPKCPSKTRQKGKSSNAKMAVIISCAAVSFFLMLAFLHLYWTKRSKRKSPPSPSAMQNLIQVSYGDLYKATSGFSTNSLLGSGGFGSVYKGSLAQVERPVAVKVLNLEKKGAFKSFKAECNALRNIRHRNLVKILSYCSSIDYKRNEFKALIYEFMEEGSLEKWLHPNVSSGNNLRNLNFMQRLNVATDVSSALYYLHELCEMTIIHCDLKPSNVLLNEDMVAHLSDFGLARLFSIGSDTSENQTSTMVIKGTVGYAAPEYGTASAASKEGDVYSFGILVLEMFTGRRPTDEMFKDGLNLHDFVKASLPTRLMHIIDPLLLVMDAEVGAAAIPDDANGIVDEEEIKNENWKWMIPEMQKCLLSLFEIGVTCSAKSPKDRLNMTDITRKLHLTKTDFISSQRKDGRHRTSMRH